MSNRKKEYLDRGDKNRWIERMAVRPEGLTGPEIIAHCKWPGASARWHVRAAGERLGLRVSARFTRNGYTAYRLLKR